MTLIKLYSSTDEKFKIVIEYVTKLLLYDWRRCTGTSSLRHSLCTNSAQRMARDTLRQTVCQYCVSYSRLTFQQLWSVIILTPFVVHRTTRLFTYDNGVPLIIQLLYNREWIQTGLSVWRTFTSQKQHEMWQRNENQCCFHSKKPETYHYNRQRTKTTAMRRRRTLETVMRHWAQSALPNPLTTTGYTCCMICIIMTKKQHEVHAMHGPHQSAQMSQITNDGLTRSALYLMYPYDNSGRQRVQRTYTTLQGIVHQCLRRTHGPLVEHTRRPWSHRAVLQYRWEKRWN